MMDLPNLVGRVTPRGSLAAFLLFSMAASTAHAQEINGVPGSPSATTAIDGKQLPHRP